MHHVKTGINSNKASPFEDPDKRCPPVSITKDV